MPDTDESSGLQDRNSMDPPSDPLGMAAPITAIPRTSAQLALHTGWTMAVLYGKIEAIPPDAVLGLPTVSELQPADRRKLELDRLRHLLQRLADMPGFAGSGLPTEVAALEEDEVALKEALSKLNLAILSALAATWQETQLAYELGRSLRDTANPPDHPDQRSLASALSRQLARDRIAALQGWLAALSSEFRPQAAAVVAGSLGRWSELAAVTAPSVAAPQYHEGTIVAETMGKYLLRQGDLWLMLLVGPSSTAGFRGSQEILRRMRRRYGFKLVLLAAALGAVIYLIVTYTSGALAVLTSVAAIGGALGISAKGIASIIATVITKDATRPVSSLAGEAEQDAMVWAITTFPSFRLNARGVRYLRKAGIGPPTGLGKV